MVLMKTQKFFGRSDMENALASGLVKEGITLIVELEWLLLVKK